MLESLWQRCQDGFRSRRARLFRELLAPRETDRILDLGGGYGDYFATVVPFRRNVWIADVTQRIIDRAARHGFRTCLIPTDGHLPFPDGFFDIVHCNSVIEHVLVPEHRRRLAAEIQRVGRRWFVQTPDRHFPLEPHTRFPLAQFLPKSWLRLWVRLMPILWEYRDDLGWQLLNKIEMEGLFPGGRIVRERFCGLSKSLIAVGPVPCGIVSPSAHPPVLPSHHAPVAR